MRGSLRARTRRLPSALLGLALSLLVAGCAALGAAPQASEPDRIAYASAEAAARTSRADGIRQLREFLRARPSSPLADDAAVRLAGLLLEIGDEDAALQPLLFVAREHPRSNRSDEARLMLAGIQHRRGHVDAAWTSASQIRMRRLQPDARRDASRLLAQLADERGEPVVALRWLAALRSDAPEAELRDLDAEIGALVARMEPDDLARAAEQLGRQAPAVRVRLRQAELALGAGDLGLAEEALSRASRLPLTPAQADRLAQLETRLGVRQRVGTAIAQLPPPSTLSAPVLPDPAQLSGTLGVALPLTGPFASLGEESLQGILLATGMFDRDGPRRGGLRLLVRDTRGTAEGAAAAVRELAEVDDLLAVLGPLGSDESEAAARAAERADLPLLALTRREDVAIDRPYVFRFGTTPRLEAELLAEYAVNDLGLRRFAILHPRDDYGNQLRAFFWEAVERRGADVVGIAAYSVDATDFADPIRSLVGFEFLSRGQRNALARREELLDLAKRSSRERAETLRAEAKALRGPGGSPLPPTVDFDALFIPDAHDNVALLAPQLAFHEIRGIRLLGTSGWNHPDLVQIARRHVNGAVFTGTVLREDGPPHAADFRRRFEATFDRPVDSFAAEAYDATNLLLRQLARRSSSRDDVRRGLLSEGVNAGVSGVVAIGPDGNADRRPHLLGVNRGELISVDQTGTAPRLPRRR